MNQPSLNHSTLLHLQAVVLHVTCDLGTRLKFKGFGCMHRTNHCPIDHHVRNIYHPFNTRMLTNN